MGMGVAQPTPSLIAAISAEERCSSHEGQVVMCVGAVMPQALKGRKPGKTSKLHLLSLAGKAKAKDESTPQLMDER